MFVVEVNGRPRGVEGMEAVDRLEDKLAGYHAYHATRADLLRRVGRRWHSGSMGRARSWGASLGKALTSPKG